MRNLGKILKNTSASSNSFECELLSFLRNYRATIHSSTNMAPNELLFKTSSTTARMPIIRQPIQPKPEILNDAAAKERMSLYGDHYLKAGISEHEIGDSVLLKELKKHTKCAQPTRYEPFTITSLKGNLGSQTLTSNISLLKKFHTTFQQPMLE